MDTNTVILHGYPYICSCLSNPQDVLIKKEITLPSHDYKVGTCTTLNEQPSQLTRLGRLFHHHLNRNMQLLSSTKRTFLIEGTVVVVASVVASDLDILNSRVDQNIWT